MLNSLEVIVTTDNDSEEKNGNDQPMCNAEVIKHNCFLCFVFRLRKNERKKEIDTNY